MTYEETLREGKRRLDQAGIESRQPDGWLLLEHVIQKDRGWYLAHAGEQMPADQQKAYWRLIGLRCQRIPLQHITGSQDFMGLPFAVTPDVLIPRQDTETLAELALEVCGHGQKVLDLCTGSGCVAISLKSLDPSLQVTASDISGAALQVARDNARRLDVSVRWVQSDLFDAVDGTFHVIVSNPPYIPTDVIRKLEPEVALYDPRQALDGGSDGLDIYRRLIPRAPHYLEEGGRLLLEIGHDQGQQVCSLMELAGFSHISVRRDLAGKDRVVWGQIDRKV